MKGKELPMADIYVFGSPGRMGRPIGKMRRFLNRIQIQSGSKYALFATQGAPRPNKRTGKLPSDEEQAKWQRTLPIMDEVLQKKGAVKIAELKLFVTGIKGPLEDGWEKKAEEFTKELGS